MLYDVEHLHLNLKRSQRCFFSTPIPEWKRASNASQYWTRGAEYNSAVPIAHQTCLPFCSEVNLFSYCQEDGYTSWRWHGCSNSAHATSEQPRKTARSLHQAPGQCRAVNTGQPQTKSLDVCCDEPTTRHLIWGVGIGRPNAVSAVALLLSPCKRATGS
uniref:Uncharacterized protein n=1 Tax=Eutreptiella gymnastica TaxID=73025 RepID=A0A7S4CXM1_9EUGL